MLIKEKYGCGEGRGQSRATGLCFLAETGAKLTK
jgi:hypothetical protein